MTGDWETRGQRVNPDLPGKWPLNVVCMLLCAMFMYVTVRLQLTVLGEERER